MAWYENQNKRKKVEINRSLRKIEGGPSSDVNIIMIDNNIAQLIGHTTIYGDAVADEFIAEFVNIWA